MQTNSSPILFNARIHPHFQQQALEGVLSSVGWVQRVIVNRATGHVVDGHLRVALAITHNERVPVDYVELTEDEEKLILASFDYITSLAVYDREQVDALLQQVNSDNAAIQQLLSNLEAQFVPPDADDWATALGGLADGDRAPFQQMTFTLHDEQAEQVKRALEVAKDMGAFTDSPNENSNGNALARICEAFITDYGQR